MICLDFSIGRASILAVQAKSEVGKYTRDDSVLVSKAKIESFRHRFGSAVFSELPGDRSDASSCSFLVQACPRKPSAERLRSILVEESRLSRLLGDIPKKAVAEWRLNIVRDSLFSRERYNFVELKLRNVDVRRIWRISRDFRVTTPKTGLRIHKLVLDGKESLGIEASLVETEVIWDSLDMVVKTAKGSTLTFSENVSPASLMKMKESYSWQRKLRSEKSESLKITARLSLEVVLFSRATRLSGDVVNGVFIWDRERSSFDAGIKYLALSHPKGKLGDFVSLTINSSKDDLKITADELSIILDDFQGIFALSRSADIISKAKGGGGEKLSASSIVSLDFRLNVFKIGRSRHSDGLSGGGMKLILKLEKGALECAVENLSLINQAIGFHIGRLSCIIQDSLNLGVENPEIFVQVPWVVASMKPWLLGWKFTRMSGVKEFSTSSKDCVNVHISGLMISLDGPENVKSGGGPENVKSGDGPETVKSGDGPGSVISGDGFGSIRCANRSLCSAEVAYLEFIVYKRHIFRGGRSDGWWIFSGSIEVEISEASRIISISGISLYRDGGGVLSRNMRDSCRRYFENFNNHRMKFLGEIQQENLVRMVGQMHLVISERSLSQHVEIQKCFIALDKADWAHFRVMVDDLRSAIRDLFGQQESQTSGILRKFEIIQVSLALEDEGREILRCMMSETHLEVKASETTLTIEDVLLKSQDKLGNDIVVIASTETNENILKWTATNHHPSGVVTPQISKRGKFSKFLHWKPVSENPCTVTTIIYEQINLEIAPLKIQLSQSLLVDISKFFTSSNSYQDIIQSAEVELMKQHVDINYDNQISTKKASDCLIRNLTVAPFNATLTYRGILHIDNAHVVLPVITFNNSACNSLTEFLYKDLAWHFMKIIVAQGISSKVKGIVSRRSSFNHMKQRSSKNLLGRKKIDTPDQMIQGFLLTRKK